jgi:hypothetical protein
LANAGAGGYGGRDVGTKVINLTITNHIVVKVDDRTKVVEAADFIESLPRERQLMKAR